jgi:ATP-dependent DNA ligase
VLASLRIDGSGLDNLRDLRDGRALFEAVCRVGLEGVVATNVASRYGANERGWIKTKNPTYWRRDAEREAVARSRQRRATLASHPPG